MCIVVTARTRQLGHVVFFLPLHASVLEPDLDLALGEAQHVCDLNTTTTSKVAVEVEFFLEFQRLESCVRLARSLRFIHAVWQPTTPNVLTSQSINQSINQSVDQSIN